MSNCMICGQTLESKENTTLILNDEVYGELIIENVDYEYCVRCDNYGLPSYLFPLKTATKIREAREKKRE